jgi:hypothetical protein
VLEQRLEEDDEIGKWKYFAKLEGKDEIWKGLVMKEGRKERRKVNLTVWVEGKKGKHCVCNGPGKLTDRCALKYLFSIFEFSFPGRCVYCFFIKKKLFYLIFEQNSILEKLFFYI